MNLSGGISLDFGCLSEYDGKVILLLENDSTITLDQVTKTDCGNSGLACYSIRPPNNETSILLYSQISELFEELANVKVKKMRVFGTERNYDFELKDEKRDIISLHIKLIKSRL